MLRHLIFGLFEIVEQIALEHKEPPLEARVECAPLVQPALQTASV